MNKIITTDILDPSIQQPFTGRSLDFLQYANLTMIGELSKTLIGNIYSTSTMYVVRGLTAYGTNQYTEGTLFYQGELYECAGKTTTTAFVNVPVLTITETNDAVADPIEFTDGVLRSVHKVRKVVLSDAVSGTGTKDLSACLYLNRWVAYTPVFTAYDSADVEVAGGVTASSVAAYYLYNNSTIKIALSIGDLDVLATVRYITMSTPSGIVSSFTAIGSGAADVKKGGAASIPSVFSGLYTSAGAGSFALRTLNGSDFGAITNYEVKSFIDIAIIA